MGTAPLQINALLSLNTMKDELVRQLVREVEGLAFLKRFYYFLGGMVTGIVIVTILYNAVIGKLVDLIPMR